MRAMWWVALLFTTACPTGPNPPPAPGPAPAPAPAPSGSTFTLTCPVLDDPLPSCPGIAITGLALTCSAMPTATLGSDPSRPNRLVGTLMNGSVVTGIARGTPLILLPGEVCHGVGVNFPFSITLGLEYTADIGPSAPICVARSKVVYTQFQVGGSVFNEAWNPLVQAAIAGSVNAKLDQAVVDSLNSTAGMPARCANYQPLP